ncbi:MAG: enoyl-CoA hydratase/isomerase family protein [Deltaproteobacteria bacterium]|nr:enoyl-CoA hydratase/isomerase family protein [Deltaproteobacteria bacterium]
MPTYSEIRVDVADGVATLTLNRPEERNAMTPAMGEEVQDACRELTSLPGLRAVIVTGAGSAFAAGGKFDFIEDVTNLPAEERRLRMKWFYRLFLAIADVPVPTIAAINGHAIGAGLCFPLACDLRIAAEGAKLGLNFVTLGLHPGMGGSFLLPRLVGVARAADLILTGRLVEATEAREIGLVSEVVPAERLLPRARELASVIARNAPIAVRQAKESLYKNLGATLDEALDREAFSQAIDYGTADLREGLSAAREKRKPTFRGE